jgi:hypothetical protein
LIYIFKAIIPLTEDAFLTSNTNDNSANSEIIKPNHSIKVYTPEYSAKDQRVIETGNSGLQHNQRVTEKALLATAIIKNEPQKKVDKHLTNLLKHLSHKLR